MNRRSFFRLVAGASAWLATQHVAWAFPHARPVLDLRVVNQVLKDVWEPFVVEVINSRSPLSDFAERAR